MRFWPGSLSESSCSERASSWLGADDKDGGPEMAPKPPTFGTPRRSRGAPRSCVRFWGPEMAPKPPTFGTPTAEPWRASVMREILGPRNGPQAPHVRHAYGGAVARLGHA